ncbi:MAG: hypothetical protein E6Q97_08915 [Desulfurellales bacterium]|nr:MAG: hypothetical protein E6Q97_08915 [Desulfurellales bacterium]
MAFTSGFITVVVDGVPTEIDAAAVEEARRRYPEMQTYLDDPEVLVALIELTEGRIDEGEFANRLRQTEAWRTSIPTEADWNWTLISDPGRAASMLDQQARDLQRLATQLGVTVAEADLRHMADQALRFGWDSTTMRNTIIGYSRNAGEAAVSPFGEIAVGAETIRRMASDYFLQVSDRQVMDMARQLAEGSLSTDGVRLWAQQSAGARWSHLQPLIDQGITMRDYFEPVRQSVARTLEMNPDDIDLTSDRWSELTDFVDDNGNRRSMTQSEAGRWARGQKEYKATDSYRESAFGVVEALARGLGVMS